MLGSTNGEAVAIGQQAIGFTSAGGSSAGWTSPIACPDSFENGLRSSAPSTDTFLKMDPKTISGPPSDPQLTAGYIATCVFQINTGTASVLEIAFFDIDDAHASAITKKLVSDGFVSQGTTNNTQDGHPYSETVYSNGTSRIVVETVTIDSTPALLIAG